MSSTRREFIKSSSLLGASMSLPWQAWGLNEGKLAVACQQYTWTTFFNRAGTSWEADYEKGFKAFQDSGLREIEFFLPEIAKVKALFAKYQIGQRSTYVNAWLHEADKVGETVNHIIQDAKAAKELGVEIVVVNPTPIDWNKPLDKSDYQLGVQREGLTELARQLKAQGQTLAYHNHDAEMRAGAREFHHMLHATDPALVKLCLDPHWIYRGAGNSSVALWDAVDMYGDRIVELHLRQSIDGIWTEAFGEGDIQYDKLINYLLKHGLKPHIVLEQAIEAKTPQKYDAIEAHRMSLDHINTQFKALKP